MIPKVNFVWSWIYEENYHAPTVKSEEFDFEKYQEKINEFLSEVKKEWDLVGDKVFEVMAKESGLEWTKEEIPCYVIKRSSYFAISDPLTIPIEHEADEPLSLSPKRFVDMVVHELAHNLIIQNGGKMQPYFDKLFENYPDEEFNVKVHLFVHALHKKVFLQVFNKERLKKELEVCEYYPDYKRSWEIVNEKGEDSIIGELKEALKLN